MKFNHLAIITLSLTTCLSPLMLADESSKKLRVALESHCVKCHGESGEVNGDVDLLPLKADRDLLAKPELLEALHGVLKDRLMPPVDEPPLTEAMRTQMLAQVEVLLRELQKTQAFEAIPIRRMNRFQYNNAVVDLLELDRDTFALEERLLRRRDDYFRPETRNAQIDRMLNDKRSSRFCDNFPAQWLQLDRLITSVPDHEMFSEFYDSDGYRMSLHMMSEPLLLFETVFIEDRSIVELLNAKFTWQSSMLDAVYAGHFNADRQVQVQEFKRVPLTDPRRGGVITNAAVMTMTATPTRTQPITRGAWVNAVIFNDPMVGPERWTTATNWEGILDKPYSHHAMTHDIGEYLEQLLILDRFHVSAFARLLERMDSIEEANGTSLLDNTIFTLGAGMGDGTTHQYNDLPLVVAGGGGGSLKLGSHIHCERGTPLANLWLTQIHALGIKRKEYADSNGTLKDILA